MTKNSPPKDIPLTIALGDASLLDRALRTLSCIEIGHPAARNRVEAIRRQLAGKIPAEARFFDPGHWAVFVSVIAAGGSFNVSYEAPSWRRYGDSYLKVTIAGASWLSLSPEHSRESGRDQALRDLLHSYSPMPDS